MTDTLAFGTDHTTNQLCWYVVGPLGGVHIWAREHDAKFSALLGKYIGGVECHWHCEAGEAHHDECWLLKGPCRHDGSSLYFSERIAPMIENLNPESDGLKSFIEAELLDWYRSNIEGEK